MKDCGIVVVSDTIVKVDCLLIDNAIDRQPARLWSLTLGNSKFDFV